MQIDRILAFFALGDSIAARVSAVSPDWLTLSSTDLGSIQWKRLAELGAIIDLRRYAGDLFRACICRPDRHARRAAGD